MFVAHCGVRPPPFTNGNGNGNGNGKATHDFNLSRREREILALLAEGKTQAQIAAALVVSPKTVATHIQHLLSKLGVHSRAQAVALAFRAGLVESDVQRALARAGGRSSGVRERGGFRRPVLVPSAARARAGGRHDRRRVRGGAPRAPREAVRPSPAR